MEELINIKDVSVVRDGQLILDNISFNVYKKDFITIVGPNGAGKTMLIKALMKFYKPNQGSVTYNKKLQKGYVPQKLVLDNIIPMSVHRFLTLNKNTNEIAFDNVVNETRVKYLLKRPISVLSGGELQRVLLARSLLDNPAILILDEPAQNLDIKGQLEFYKLLEKVYQKRDLTILMVSHDLHLVMSCSKKVICLYKHICCFGKPQVISKNPEFISIFGESLAQLMSFYNHEHTHNHDHSNTHIKN